MGFGLIRSVGLGKFKACSFSVEFDFFDGGRKSRTVHMAAIYQIQFFLQCVAFLLVLSFDGRIWTSSCQRKYCIVVFHPPAGDGSGDAIDCLILDGALCSGCGCVVSYYGGRRG